MALIPKVETKQEKKVVSAHLNEEGHTMLQRYTAFLGRATQEYIIGESLKCLFRRDREFNKWLEKNRADSTAIPETPQPPSRNPKNATRIPPTAA